MQNDLLRFAAAHLSPYRIRGDELIPELCPFCYGGQNADRHTFALNLTDGVYVCKRGGTSARGRFEQLAAHFGERAEPLRPISKGRKQYALPDIRLQPQTDAIDAYFEKRKIGHGNAGRFPHRQRQKRKHRLSLLSQRHAGVCEVRAPHKPQPGEKKEWQAAGARPILFGMDLCSFSQP